MTKPTKWLCAQRRLGSAWAFAQSDQSSVCTQLVVKDPNFLHADSEESDLTGQNAQADLSLHWPHKSFCSFYSEVVQITNKPSHEKRDLCFETLKTCICSLVKTARMCRLVWAFAVRLCVQYPFHIGWSSIDGPNQVPYWYKKIKIFYFFFLKSW